MADFGAQWLGSSGAEQRDRPTDMLRQAGFWAFGHAGRVAGFVSAQSTGTLSRNGSIAASQVSGWS